MLSLIPILIYLLIIKLLDNFSLVKWHILAECFGSGVLVCVMLLMVDTLNVIPEWLYPPVEELAKGSIALILIFRQKILFFAEALCFGTAIGAGFALCENLAYSFYNTDMSELVFAFRGLGTALLHMGNTALLATIALSVNKYLAIIPSTIIHYVYNMFLLPESLQIIITIIFFFIVFGIISYYDEKRLYNWLDVSITDDVALLISIHEGKLTETPAGKYLLKIQKQFPAEVFFDIICYVQLYLEILIKGKSRLLLEEQGLAEPLSEEEKESERSMKAELHALRKNIGPMGIQLLRPILRYNAEDEKILK